MCNIYVIKKGLLYVSLPGRKKPYTNQLKYAKRFSSLEEAKRNKCGNEKIINIKDEI